MTSEFKNKFWIVWILKKDVVCLIKQMHLSSFSSNLMKDY